MSSRLSVTAASVKRAYSFSFAMTNSTCMCVTTSCAAFVERPPHPWTRRLPPRLSPSQRALARSHVLPRDNEFALPKATTSSKAFSSKSAVSERSSKQPTAKSSDLVFNDYRRPRIPTSSTRNAHRAARATSARKRMRSPGGASTKSTPSHSAIIALASAVSKLQRTDIVRILLTS